MKHLTLDNLDIAVDLYVHDNPMALLIQPLERKEVGTIGHEVSLIAQHTPHPFVMAAFKIDDWHLQMSPWHDDAISRREEVGHHAEETLRFITHRLLPVLQQRFGDLPVVLGGYSLAALFSLWAATQTDVFTGIAAASPSVWIDGWQTFASSHPILSMVAYLSIGRKEEHVRNLSMARVGANIRFEQQLLEQQLGPNNTTLQWNEGGHFDHMDARTAQAYAWTINKFRALR
ncbi:alpha/beta hydrolase-fold protein [Hallella sp.]|uniref:alpha/beta hydrolase-fold protein n=1 Tax=Hallella sp. TaxID=2980186 RepID=UPI003079EC81